MWTFDTVAEVVAARIRSLGRAVASTVWVRARTELATRESWRGGRVIAVSVLAALLSGCGTEAIVVSEAAITDSPDARVVGWTAEDAPRLVFSPEDEEVTLHALFEFNYRGVYEWYRVEWIAPDGSPYKVVSLRTDFGSHRDLKATLKIRGKMASRLPGVWRVRIWLRGRDGAEDRLLVSRLFRISEPTAEMLRAGLTPVDAPDKGAPRPLAAVPVPPRAAATQPPPRAAVGAAAAGAVSAAATASPPDDFPLLPPLAVGVPDSSVAAAPEVAVTPDSPSPVPLQTAAVTPDSPSPVPLQTAAAPEPGPAPPAYIASPMPSAAQPAAAPADTGSPASPVPAPAEPAATESTASSVVSVSLTTVPENRKPFAPPSAKLRYPGCPPMYYPPGPGCVEEAPEE